MILRLRWFLPMLCAVVLSGQSFEVQMERDRQERREAETRQAQLDQQRQIERQSDRDLYRLNEQRLAQENAQQRYVIERQQQELAAAVPARPQEQEIRHAVATAAAAAQPKEPVPAIAVTHWSFRNFRIRDEFGLALLGVLLIALAFPAGLLPRRLRF